MSNEEFETTPSVALDAANKLYLVLIAFAKEEDFERCWDVVAQKCELLDINVLRIEPNEENAIDMQLNKHPTYILYRSGNEDWTVVGNQEFVHKISTLRT